MRTLSTPGAVYTRVTSVVFMRTLSTPGAVYTRVTSIDAEDEHSLVYARSLSYFKPASNLCFTCFDLMSLLPPFDD